MVVGRRWPSQLVPPYNLVCLPVKLTPMLPKLPTIEEARRLMRQKDLTPLDLVEHCLGRIAQFEDRIHAWVLVDAEGTRKEARRQTDMLARGETIGPLHGIPIGIKDIIDVAGWQTKCGSKLRENVAPAEKDATVVANLRKAGAIILGKTVTTEFACFDPPPTRNPWNLNHTPGGSSSGSAAAVAMEMCMAALGTQTGGSIIRPAAYCGVCGFKPSASWATLAGIMPLTLHLDHAGPMAKCIADLSIVAQAALDPDQMWCSTREDGSPFRFAVCQDYFRQNSAADVWLAFETALSQIHAKSCVIAKVELPPGFELVHSLHRRIMAAEAASIHRREYSMRHAEYSTSVSRLIDEGLALNAVDYAEALFHRNHFWRDFWRWIYPTDDQRYDAVLIPATPATAPTTETTGDPKFNLPWSYAGVPAATIPIGASESGLPIGMQLIGGDEMDTLDAARFCEQVIEWDERPSLIKELS